MRQTFDICVVIKNPQPLVFKILHLTEETFREKKLFQVGKMPNIWN